MKLIVGLGNPGDKYTKTRHNVGFTILDNYAKVNNYKFKKDNKSEIVVQNQFILLKPLSFMNNSGLEIKRIVDYYKISNNDILVIHDDKDLNFGDIKIKNNSGSGGHNGVNDIIIKLKSQNFGRLKIGINSFHNKDTANFVLSNFTNEEYQHLIKNYAKFNRIIDDFLSMSLIELMNIYNGNKNDF